MNESTIERRRFLKTASASALTAASGFGRGRSQQLMVSDAYRLVAETDRLRILSAAQEYVSQSPLTITAFPAKRSAGGLHDFYSQADYFWPNPNNPNGPYINRDGQSNPDNFDDHRRVMVALSRQVPALTAAWLLTGEPRVCWVWMFSRQQIVTPSRAGLRPTSIG